MMLDAPAIPDVDHSSGAATGHRLLYLDGWRGLCIVMVIIGHFAPIHVIDFGNLGVEMFFVLSGRLMADILFVEKFPLRQFYIRRFSRVWPGLFIYVAVCAVAFYGRPGFLHVGPAAVIAALTFTTNYKVAMLGQTQLLDHTWSLSVEEHSYLLLGVIAFLLRGRSPNATKYIILALAIAMAANGILRTYVFPTHIIDFPGHRFEIYWLSDIRCASIFFAVFVYLQLQTSSILRRALSTPAIPFLLLLSVVLFVSSISSPVKFIFGTLCLAIAVCSFETAGQHYRNTFSQKFLVLFGTYSFSIYIWQQLFYKLFQSLRDSGALTQTEGLISRPVFVILACAAGVLSYYFVETPARRFINKRWGTQPA